MATSRIHKIINLKSNPASHKKRTSEEHSYSYQPTSYKHLLYRCPAARLLIPPAATSSNGAAKKQTSMPSNQHQASTLDPQKIKPPISSPSPLRLPTQPPAHASTHITAAYPRLMGLSLETSPPSPRASSRRVPTLLLPMPSRM